MEKNQLKIIIKLKGLSKQALFLSQKEVVLNYDNIRNVLNRSCKDTSIPSFMEF